MDKLKRLARKSFLEASARSRIQGLLDPGSFEEWLDPRERLISPHLESLGVPGALDDGIVIGQGRLQGELILVAAQEGRFMGGAVGEIHGAKMTGLLQRAIMEKPAAVLLLLDTGGVRLHEANAGLVAISEIQRAIFDARHAGIPCIALIGSGNGCYGGIGIVAPCCDAIIMSEEGRLSVSGPEVIETTQGVEEFDARDRALVWRTMGGKHRYLMGDADQIVADDIAAFREAAMAWLGESQPITLESVLTEHEMLRARLEQFGQCGDAIDIWQTMGISHPEKIPSLDTETFHHQVDAIVERMPHAAK